MMPEPVPVSPGSNEPRSCRVDLVLSSDPPPTYVHVCPPRSPPLPPRSPLRPPPSSATRSDTDPSDSAYPHEPPFMPLPMMNNRSFGSLANLLDSLIPAASESVCRGPAADSKLRTPPPNGSADSKARTPPPNDLIEKPLPLAPEPSIGGSTLVDEPRLSAAPPAAPAPKPISKRTHALLELLSSERAYASDLALIRDIHIPLALGEEAAFPITPPPSSCSSERTLSTSSSSSSSSGLGAPMTRADTRIIFNNVAELAVFSDEFGERLEAALGCVLEGGKGEDYVGEVFIDMVPRMEAIYKAYITRHPAALEHLNHLPQTPALQAYLAHTRELAATLTHAWDLPSLLIKPVQRLLKYSLLLHAIIEETADGHPDKARLRRAKAMMEGVSHAVNEGQRRREIVKEVLALGKPSAAELLKKRGLTVTAAASVNFGRAKGSKAALSKAENEEAEQVAVLEKQVRDAEAFVHAFTKEAVDWTNSVSRLTDGLKDWATAFGDVIGICVGGGSEAFDAFMNVVDPCLLQLCSRMEVTSREQLLPQLKLLVESTTQPLLLLDAMHSFEPFHHTLLNHNVAKGRPAPALLEASTAYVALRGQLHTELPAYIRLLHRGLVRSTEALAAWQAGFWEDVREQWGELWNALRVEGEMNAGHDETERVWRARFRQVEEDVQRLAIVHLPRVLPLPRTPTSSTSGSSLQRSDTARSGTRTVRMEIVASMLTALDPVHDPQLSPIADSFMTGKSSAASASRRQIARRPSDGSLRSIRSAKSGKSSTKSARLEDLPTDSPRPADPPRRRSMPVPLRKGSTSGKMFDGYAPHTPTYEGVYGRKPASLKQNVMDSLRPSLSRRSSSRSRKQTPHGHHGHDHDPAPPYSAAPPRPPPVRKTISSKWHHARPLYECRVVHTCDPPDGVAYYGLPFFRLRVGDVYAVLKESGHPSTHDDLPLYVENGDDCLLLARDVRSDELGWVLGSFLYPVD